MRRPRDPRDMGFEPIYRSAYPDEFRGQPSVGPVGRVTREDRIDRGVQAGGVVRFDNQIVENSSHSRTSLHDTQAGCRRPSAKPSNSRKCLNGRGSYVNVVYTNTRTMSTQNGKKSADNLA